MEEVIGTIDGEEPEDRGALDEADNGDEAVDEAEDDEEHPRHSVIAADHEGDDTGREVDEIVERIHFKVAEQRAR